MIKKAVLLTAITAVILTFSNQEARAQDPELSQFYGSPVYTNPAMAGTGQCDRKGSAGRVATSYRNQWPSLPGGGFTTAVFSYDQDFNGINGGLGVMVMRDVAGEGRLSTTQASAIYSYHLPITHKLSMRFGIEGQVMQRAIDFSKLNWEDEIVASRGFVNQTQEQFANSTVTTPNFNTGWLVYTNRFYAGIAVHNVIEPIQSFYGNTSLDARLPRRYTVHAGSIIPLDKRGRSNSNFSPNLLFMSQAQFTQMNVGFYVNRGPLVTGLSFRQTFGEAFNSDALIVLLGFKKEQFKFGYSLDLTVDSKRAAARSAHEISVTYEWCAKKPIRKYHSLPCPW